VTTRAPSDLAGERRLDAVHLCVLDVDGTLLGSDHHVSPVTARAVERAVGSGIEIMLATSRGPGALETVLREVPALDGRAFIASQGAVVGRYTAPGRLELLAHRPAPLEAAREVVGQAVARGVSTSWYTRDRWLVGRWDDEIRREARVTQVAPEVTDLSSLAEGPDKLLLVSARDPDLLTELLAGLPAGLRGQFSQPTYADVTAADVDKATALAAYLDGRGLHQSQVLAAGDGLNDLGMLALAGLSAAPANAHTEVLAVADLVLPAQDEDGIATLLTALVARRSSSS
jgi:Cof subfamily protein (haloacid dehalogenase superfamily)